MEPKISVIVPVYNVEKYLNRCINSILNQSHKNIEIILVNDASSDRSGSICDAYREKNKNVIVIHRKTSGGSASKARNAGLKIASGAYVAFIDSDDWIHPNMMTISLKAILENKTKVAECDLMETAHYAIKPIEKSIEDVSYVEDRLTAFKRIINNQRFSVCVRLYDLDLVKNFSFPENVISEDVYFTLEVIKNIENLVRVNLPFYYYFITPNSITRKSYSLKYFDSLNSGLYLQKYVDNNENDPELIKITRSHILKKLLYHYKMLNYTPKVDPDYTNRKYLKELIDKNYFKDQSHESYLRYAKSLSIKSFELLINLNKMRHKILKTNEF